MNAAENRQPRCLSREQVRRVDAHAIQHWGIPGMVLMENAGRGAADLLCRLGISGPVVVCCGRGNNGGDGLVLARHLNLRGHPVRVILWCRPEELSGDAATNFAILARTDVPIEWFAQGHDARRFEQAAAGAAWLVDALLGTGARGKPRPPYDAAIDALNATAAPKLAVDVPSGLDCDTGLPDGTAIRAAHTATFVAMKPGFLVPGSRRFTGEVHVLDIGVPWKLVEETL